MAKFAYANGLSPWAHSVSAPRGRWAGLKMATGEIREIFRSLMTWVYVNIMINRPWSPSRRSASSARPPRLAAATCTFNLSKSRYNSDWQSPAMLRVRRTRSQTGRGRRQSHGGQLRRRQPAPVTWAAGPGPRAQTRVGPHRDSESRSESDRDWQSPNGAAELWLDITLYVPRTSDSESLASSPPDLQC